MRTVFLLVPSPHPTGPVKGAYAMANAFALSHRVVLVFLKPGPGVDAPLDGRVEVVSLATAPGGWTGRRNSYRQLLRDAGGRRNVGSVSLCLSADWLNRSCRDLAVTCASVRGNLPQNYRLDYGWPGLFLAIGHLLTLRAFDHVVAMTAAMARQIHLITGVRARVIGNFVDEAALECYHRRRVSRPGGPPHFVFVGSLSRRKQPELLIDAVEQLAAHEIRIDMIGDGPLRPAIERRLVDRGLHGAVRLHGQLANPYPLVASADALVLPSRSEGVSRAALEALHLGVPCVLRDVDGNGELLRSAGAGILFRRDQDLAAAMLAVAGQARGRATLGESLLPPFFRQTMAAGQYLALLEATRC